MVTVATGLGSEVSELLAILARTTDGMVAIDPAMRIIGWNEAATDLLGYEPEDAMGLPCYQILGWHDRHGNIVCDADCPSCSLSSRDQLIETREVMGRTGSGRALWLSVSTVVPPPRLRGECQMVHFIREGALPPRLEEALVERIAGAGVHRDGDRPGVLEPLTLREREVLGLLAEGMHTREIAARLVLSPTTVRNHIQHVLTKLGVHSRLEAVALALRNPE